MPTRQRSIRIVFSVCFLIAPCTVWTVQAAKLETWRQESATAFNKGKKDRVIITDSGRIRLSHALAPTSPIEALRVWDLARSKNDEIYAATGDAGKVYRLGAAPDAAWAVAYDAEDTQALALVVTPGGKVFVGTGPNGRIIEISDPRQPVETIHADVQYIWDLASDAEGSLYAATGPNGQLWKRSPAGAWSKLLDSKHPHLLCVAISGEGAVIAGSDGEGLIYKVARDGKVSILYDASQNEVRSLAIGPDGQLYAGTAATAPTSSGSGGGSGRVTATVGGAAARIRTVAFVQDKPAQANPSGTARPSPAAAGENAVYRIGTDGAVREVFRAKVLINTLAWQADRLLIGTGPDGQIFEISDEGRETATIARLDHGQVLSLLLRSNGDLLIGAGDPGAVFTLGTGHATSGTFTSDVHDSKLISRFGVLEFHGDRPEGTRLAVQVRTGNVGEPDETWSDWTKAQADPSARLDADPARFIQYRVNLATEKPSATPEVRSIAIRYQTLNLAPEISKLDVPDVAAGDGATRQSQFTLRWDASDPNGDDLTYELHVRKEGWPDWIRLGGDRPLTEKSYSWDTTALPPGTYRVRVTASDRLSNLPDETLTRRFESEPFLVDHESPKVVLQQAKGDTVKVVLTDRLTRLVKASYALDGGEWVPIFPIDGLFDSREETLEIRLPRLEPGAHVLMVRTTDAAGNTASSDAVLQSR